MRRREFQAQFEALSGLTPLTFEQVRLWCLTRMSDWDPREVQSVLESFVAADPQDRASASPWPTRTGGSTVRTRPSACWPSCRLRTRTLG